MFRKEEPMSIEEAVTKVARARSLPKGDDADPDLRDISGHLRGAKHNGIRHIKSYARKKRRKGEDAIAKALVKAYGEKTQQAKRSEQLETAGDVAGAGGTAALLASFLAKNPGLSRKLVVGGLGSHLAGIGAHMGAKSQAKKSMQPLNLEALLKDAAT